MKKALMDKVLVEIDQERFHLKRRSLVRIESPGDVVGDKWLITDFAGASPRHMLLDAPVRYVETLVQRRLQEMGEVGQNARILTHWKKARGKSAAELYFTAVAGDIYRPYEDHAFEDTAQHLVFPLGALLLACLREYGRHRTVAVVFEHARHADYLLGRDGQVLAAGRLSTYADDLEAKGALADSLGEELRTMGTALNRRVEYVVHFSWLRGRGDERTHATASGLTLAGSGQTRGWGSANTTEQQTGTGWLAAMSGQGFSEDQARLAAAEWVRAMAGKLEVECLILKPQLLELEGGDYVITSLHRVLGLLHHSLSCSPMGEQWQYASQRLLPAVAAASWLLVGGVYVGGLYLQQETNRIETQRLGVERGVESKVTLPPLPENYKEWVTFPYQLSKLRSSPTLGAILADISSARKGDLSFDRVAVDYDDNAVASIVLEGRIPVAFEQGSRLHASFLSALVARGYEVVHTQFATTVSEVSFTVQLKRGGMS
ncbi:MAG: hypothetical protein H7831_01640 [Magnetococcus sp. WYHC-3]